MMRQSGLYRMTVGMISSVSVLFMSSCAENDFDRNAAGVLSFNVDVECGWSGGASGTVSRGAPVADTAPLENNGFGLSAICYTGTWPEDGLPNSWTTNFAHNLKTNRQGAEWTTSEKLYWPGSGNIKFFAYYPHSGSSECVTHSGRDATGVPVLTYTVPDDVTKQPDILYATADSKGDCAGKAVELAFGHALTAVTVKHADNRLKGTITCITFSNIYGQGKYAIGADSWTAHDNKKSFKITPGDTSGEMIAGGELTLMMVPQTLPNDAVLTVDVTDDNNTTTSLTAQIGGKEWPFGRHIVYSVGPAGIDVVPDADGGDWTAADGSEKAREVVINYEPEDLKMGDYYYSDGRVSDGGLRKLTITYTYTKDSNGTVSENVAESREWVPERPGPENDCIGIVFHVGRHKGDSESDYTQGRYTDDNCLLAGGIVHGYVVALSDDVSEKTKWSPSREYIGCTTTDSDPDWNGYSWTKKIIDKAGGCSNLSKYPATDHAVNYKPDAPASSSGWFLPAIKQLKSIFDNREQLFKGMEENFSNEYWSSTEINRNSVYSFKNGEQIQSSKTNSSRDILVRPILVF